MYGITPEASSLQETSFPLADKPLPEDFVIRGHIWSQQYFPTSWFDGAEMDVDEHSLKGASMVAAQIKRILRLGFQIAAGGQWITYNEDPEKFQVSTTTTEP